MAGLTAQMLTEKIVHGIFNTFLAKGIDVEVHAQHNFEKNELEFCVQYGARREYLSVEKGALGEWAGRSDRPLRFTNGVEIWFRSDSAKPSEAKGTLSAPLARLASG